jgi:hypothetical protein
MVRMERNEDESYLRDAGLRVFVRNESCSDLQKRKHSCASLDPDSFEEAMHRFSDISGKVVSPLDM